MSLHRTIYFSENLIGVARRNTILKDLLARAIARNRPLKVTGALLHDDLWFVQALEGPPAALQVVLDRILRDPRHTNIKVVSRVAIRDRLFGAWSMGFAARSPRTEPLFGAHWCNKGMNPSSMSESDILRLMSELGKQGLMEGASDKAA